MSANLRYVFRQLAKTPTFTAVALLSLALCIGANSAIFSIVRNGIFLICSQASVLVAVGISAGLALHWGLSKLLTQFLFGVGENDLSALIAAPGVLAVIAMIASLVPVLRAARVDPIVSLRSS